MDAHRRKHLQTGAVCCGGLLAFLLLLPLTLPVVLGVLAAAALEPLILRLQRRTGMGRGGAAALCVTGALALLGALLWTLGRALLREAVALSRQLPELLEAAAGWAAALSKWLSALSTRLPDGIGDALSAWAENLVSGGGALAQGAYERAFSTASRLLGALPGMLLFLMTLILAWYFAAGELPRLRELLRIRLPEPWGRRLRHGADCVKAALGGWLRAQVRLMAVMFLLLSLGFLLLGVGSPLLLGLGVAALDALPLFGTGTVLIPWALLSALRGAPGLALGLTGLYGAAALLRNVLEPRLLGAQLGVSPLLTLAAIYGGWRIGGVWGMLLLPVGVMTGAQLWRSLRASPVREPEPWQKVPKRN